MSRSLRTTYHILPIYYYDLDLQEFDFEKIVFNTINSQNSLGGYSFRMNSDACEDIDSAYLLCISNSVNEQSNKKIEDSLHRFLRWVYVNKNRDGGFVFNRFKAFQYADQNKLSSRVNESNMFATWFRVLSIAFASEKIGLNHHFNFSKVPGYQFYRQS